MEEYPCYRSHNHVRSYCLGKSIILLFMNRITDDLKRNLLGRHPQLPTVEEDPHSNYRPIPNSQHKFMELFQSMNRPSHSFAVTQPKGEENEQIFAKTMKEYTSTPRFIDGILELNEDAVQLRNQIVPLAEPPLLTNQKVGLEKTVREITEMFEGSENTNMNEILNKSFMDLQAFSQALSCLGRRNKMGEAKSQARNKAIIREPSPSFPPAKSLKQIQVDTQQLQSQWKQQQKDEAERMGKIDLILMELTQEKKRKNFITDYYSSMEIKLMEMLDYILQDEAEYAGLQPSAKTRLVLKNLEKFQGKTLDGESKINLLRMFFEQFTALKKEKQESTPMKKVQNRQKNYQKTSLPSSKKGKKSQAAENSISAKKGFKNVKPLKSQKKDQWIVGDQSY